MKDIKELPESLVKAYFEMMRSDIKERINNDSDY
jgi:hypothetical protein